MTYKKIQNYENYYVSDNGSVYKNGKILQTSIDKDGYEKINLSKDGKFKTYRVNRLILDTFQPTEDKTLECNHKNGDRKDNRLSNLEWITHKENCNRVNRKNAKSKTVICLETGEIFSSTREAENKIKIDHSAISKCCIGKYKIAGGYHFSYI